MEDNELNRATSQPQLPTSSSNQIHSLKNQSHDSLVGNTFGSEGHLSNANTRQSGFSAAQPSSYAPAKDKILNDTRADGDHASSSWRNITRSDESFIHNQTEAGLFKFYGIPAKTLAIIVNH